MFNKIKSEEAEIEMTGSQIKQEAPEINTFKMVYGFGCPTSKDFLRLWVGYWKEQKGKGTLRPTTRLKFLVTFTRKRKNSCHFDSKNRRSLPK